MRLQALAAEIAGATVVQGGDRDVSRVTHDSRAVKPGDLYVALPGQRVDGRRFIPQALAAGAAAVAGLPACAEDVPAETGFLALAEPRAALGGLAAAVLGHPSRTLTLIGITGTNGKTTTSTLLADMAAAAGAPAGLIGTVEHRVGARTVPAKHTTPEAPDLQALFDEMRTAGVRVAAMEVSSIGVCEHRIAGLNFQVGAFLNLTPDHLDYHGSLAAYGQAKADFFRSFLAPEATAVVSVDDAYAANMVAAVPAGRAIWRASAVAGPRSEALEVYYHHLEASAAGLSGIVRTPVGDVPFASPLVGAFNASNILVAVACARAAGLPASAIAAGLSTAKVRGRLERVPGPAGAPTVLVDYAHTPDALSRAIEAVRPFTRGTLWVVFGCGGDRDRGKRPLMGAAAAAADAVVVTTDNPRSEAPADIANAALAGVIEAGKPLSEAPRPGAVACVLDRRAAIEATLRAAREGDVVLLAGKGHETYQEIAGVRHDFDDAAVAACALAARSPGVGEGAP